MRGHHPKRFQAGVLALCLLLLPGSGAVAQDELPQFLPFRSISGDGAVGLWGDFFRLSFDADFRLDPQSDGIHLGDDVQIVTSLAFPVPTLQAATLGLPIHRLVVRLAVVGQCFEPRGRALVFRAPDEGAIAGCADVGVQIFDGAGTKLFDGDFDHILQTVTVELLPVGRRGRWKLRSVAAFADPGFPFPVAGYEYDAQGRLAAGVTLIVADDGGFSPFRTVGFRTLAP